MRFHCITVPYSVFEVKFTQMITLSKAWSIQSMLYLIEKVG